MTRPTRAEIDLGALRHNYRQIRTFLPRNVRIMPAIKADAYEHGAVRCARALADAGADAFGVAIVEEGIQLRETGVNIPILIFSAILAEQIPVALRYGLMPTVSDVKFAQEVAAAAARRGSKAAIHIKIDTGMGRVGVLHHEAVEVISRIADIPGLILEGIYTHFSTADEEDKSFTREQIRIFDDIILRLRERGIVFKYRHAANSGAMLDVPQSYCDMVRPGILLYGIYPSPYVTRRLLLRQVMTVKTNITLLKRFPQGYGISYGRTYITPDERLIATIPIGYEDGFFRAYSNKAHVLVRGQRAPVVGTVCMDQTLIDVTEIRGVQVGDEVVIYGRQEDEEISIEEAAHLAGTIPYEVVTLVGKRVPRIYVE